MKKLSFLFALAGVVLFSSCGDDDPVVVPEPTITAQSFIASVMENPELGQSIGTVTATTSSGTINYSLSMVAPDGAIAINSSTGEITVADVAAFDFETNAEVTAKFSATVSNTTEMAEINIAITDVDEGGGGPTFTIFEGDKITFTKENGADPTDSANQDRLNDDVIITRGNGGGQIFNIAQESEVSKDNSPVGTEWALGTTADIASLTFAKFRATVGEPKQVVGKDLVLHLIDEDVYLDVKFTQWTTGNTNGGGFAYERSSR